jgi:hypothetical protein
VLYVKRLAIPAYRNKKRQQYDFFENTKLDLLKQTTIRFWNS